MRPPTPAFCSWITMVAIHDCSAENRPEDPAKDRTNSATRARILPASVMTVGPFTTIWIRRYRGRARNCWCRGIGY
jgi:hypothetical protein